MRLELRLVLFVDAGDLHGRINRRQPGAKLLCVVSGVPERLLAATRNGPGTARIFFIRHGGAQQLRRQHGILPNVPRGVRLGARRS